MSTFRVVFAASLLCAALATAGADEYSLHVTSLVQGAWTDNLLSAPEDSVPPEPEHVSDIYYQLQPGVLATYATGRMVFQASYQLEANLYQKRDDAASLQHQVGLDGFFLTSPRTELTTNVRLQTGVLSSFSTQTISADGQFMLSPSGNSSYTSAEISEILSYTATREWRLSENLRFRRFSSKNETTPPHTVGSGEEFMLQGTADRGFRHSAVSMMAGASLSSMGGHDDLVADTGTTRQINANVIGSWRRDFGPEWSLSLDAGVTSIISLKNPAPSFQPTVGAQIGYFPLWGSAGASLRRSVAPNLMVRQNTISDSASVNASLPLPWLATDPAQPKLSIGGSLGVSRTQLMDVDLGIPTGQYDVVGGDVSLNYHVFEGSIASIRYQYINQIVGEVGGGDSPPPVFPYQRNTVMISIGGRFPYRLAAEVPQRDSLRVDRSDNTPVGEEVPASVAPGGSR